MLHIDLPEKPNKIESVAKKPGDLVPTLPRGNGFPGRSCGPRTRATRSVGWGRPHAGAWERESRGLPVSLDTQARFRCYSVKNIEILYYDKPSDLVDRVLTKRATRSGAGPQED